MTKKILMFGFDALPAILAVEAAVRPFGAELVPVSRTDYGKPLAVLAGLDTATAPAAPYAGMGLGERMLVLCGLEKEMGALLPALAKAGAGPDCLKAVLTSHNRGWSPVTLYAELVRERRSLRGK